ncbi:MAG: diguanylate cyclase [Paracoccaceae bacterium]
MAGKILIVDDVATNRILMKVRLAASCYDTLQAGDGLSAVALAREFLPKLVLLDLLLPDIDGVEVCRRLRADSRTRDIPILIVSARDDVETRMRALAAGADDYLTKPLNEQVLLARLRSLLRAREAADELAARDETRRELGFAEPAVLPFTGAADAGGSVALIAGAAALADRWRADLAPLLGGHRLTVLSREQALADLDPAEGTDVFVIAADLSQPHDGLRLMSELRSRSGTRHAAVCVVVPEGAQDEAAMAFDLGASDLMPEPFDPREMALRINLLLRRKRVGDRLRETLRDGIRLAAVDPLTGLYNRRYALPHLARLLARSRETGKRIAVLALDLDRFKAVNDTYGHAAGDAVLVEVAARLGVSLRSADILARIGGEEFLVAMPDTSLADARGVAERLCAAVKSRPFTLPGGESIEVTISIGLAVSGTEAETPEQTVAALLDRADRALLSAKSEGRDQVTVNCAA